VRTVSDEPGAHARELLARQRPALLDVLQKHLECDLVHLERRRRTAERTALRTAECTALFACRVRVRVRV
jgi:hypothetical protein